MNKARAATAVAATTAAMALALTGTAQAVQVGTGVSHGASRASATLELNGAIFRVSDNYVDGYGARVYYSSSVRSGSCTNEQGGGTTVTCDLPIGGGVAITWRLCIKDNETLLACTAYRTDRTT